MVHRVLPIGRRLVGSTDKRVRVAHRVLPTERVVGVLCRGQGVCTGRRVVRPVLFVSSLPVHGGECAEQVGAGPGLVSVSVAVRFVRSQMLPYRPS